MQLSCTPLVPKQALYGVAGAGCDSATAGTTTTEVAKTVGPRIVYPAVSSLPRIYRSVANPPSSSFPHQPRAPPLGMHLAQTAADALAICLSPEHTVNAACLKSKHIIQDACISWVFCLCVVPRPPFEPSQLTFCAAKCTLYDDSAPVCKRNLMCQLATLHTSTAICGRHILQ